MSKKGFTLIEILIVVAIIAILSSVVLIGLGPTQRIGRDARRLSDLRQTQNALELYFNKNGAYPTGVSTWSALQTALTGAGVGVSQVPNDPTTGKNYYYGVSTNGTDYVLGAQLEDLHNQALLQAPDAAINGVSCSRASGLYCVQL